MVYIYLLLLVSILGGYGSLVWVLVQTYKDKRRVETQLLSVLGKTETVALHLRDERPPGEVRYVDDEAMANGKRE